MTFVVVVITYRNAGFFNGCGLWAVAVAVAVFTDTYMDVSKVLNCVCKHMRTMLYQTEVQYSTHGAALLLYIFNMHECS